MAPPPGIEPRFRRSKRRVVSVGPRGLGDTVRNRPGTNGFAGRIHPRCRCHGGQGGIRTPSARGGSFTGCWLLSEPGLPVGRLPRLELGSTWTTATPLTALRSAATVGVHRIELYLNGPKPLVRPVHHTPLVPLTGLAPARPEAPVPKTGVAAKFHHRGIAESGAIEAHRSRGSSLSKRARHLVGSLSKVCAESARARPTLDLRLGSERSSGPTRTDTDRGLNPAPLPIGLRNRGGP